MRLALTIACLALGSALALAQAEGSAKSAPAKPGDSQHSDGRTVSPETKGVQQPQGMTGPTETTSGGAPPESPQGQTPPGMQSAPGGSQKTVVDPEAGKKDSAAQLPPQPSATRQPSADGIFQNADGIFQNGVLTVPGANPDNQAAPAKFSKHTDAADQLPIAAYALRHLGPDQRSRIHQALHKSMGISGHVPEPVVGAEISADVVFHGLQPIPDELTRDIPELKGLAYVQDGNKVMLASPTMHRVLAVIER
jgi:hypothetical protein